MRLMTALLISILLSACAHSTSQMEGVDNVIDIPAGGIIENVPLPTDENKTYRIVTKKPGRWVSLEAWARYEKMKG